MRSEPDVAVVARQLCEAGAFSMPLEGVLSARAPDAIAIRGTAIPAASWIRHFFMLRSNIQHSSPCWSNNGPVARYVHLPFIRETESHQ